MMASFLLMPSHSRGLLISNSIISGSAKFADRKPAVGDMSLFKLTSMGTVVYLSITVPTDTNLLVSKQKEIQCIDKN